MVQSVAFLFLHKSKVLLSYRQTEHGMPVVFQIPQGEIEQRDRGHRHAGDDEHAMHRIIYEMFGGTVIPLQYELAGVFDDDPDRKVSLFFVYVWEGEHPLYEMKNGERIGRLRWFQVDDVLVGSTNVLQREMLRLAKEKIRIRSVLLSRTYR